MTTTLLSLVIIWLAILPGILFIWAFEQQAGRWVSGIRGGVLRSVGYSAIFHFLVAPLTYKLWSSYWEPLFNGDRVSFWMWGALAVYTVVPVVLGLLVGRATKKSNRWPSYFMGNSPAPRAWDFLFVSDDLSGWVRIHTKSGRSIVGFYGQGSYTAGYPEIQDLYITYIIDEKKSFNDMQEMIQNMLEERRGLLIRWDEVKYLEFIPSERRNKDA